MSTAELGDEVIALLALSPLLILFSFDYDRTLRVVFSHNQVDFPLEMDTGGYLLMNIHRLPDRRLMLFDGLAYIVIDPQRDTVEYVNEPVNVSAAEYVGCFDWPEGGTFGFIPAGIRPEKPLRRPG